MKVPAIKIVQRAYRSQFSQDVLPEASAYFPFGYLLRTDGFGRLLILNECGEVNYSRDMSSISEISYQEVELA